MVMVPICVCGFPPSFFLFHLLAKSSIVFRGEVLSRDSKCDEASKWTITLDLANAC